MYILWSTVLKCCLRGDFIAVLDTFVKLLFSRWVNWRTRKNTNEMWILFMRNNGWWFAITTARRNQANGFWCWYRHLPTVYYLWLLNRTKGTSRSNQNTKIPSLSTAQTDFLTWLLFLHYVYIIDQLYFFWLIFTHSQRLHIYL